MTPPTRAGRDACPHFAEQSVPEIFSVPRYPWSHDHARKPAQWRITKRKGEIKQGSNSSPRSPGWSDKEGLDYEGWRYVAKKVRQVCDLRPEKKGRRLPRVLTTDEFRRFYQIVDRAEDVQHALMLRLLFFTAVRVSELCNIGISEVDIEACKIRVNQGKGCERQVRAVRQVLRHRPANPHRCPPA